MTPVPGDSRRIYERFGATVSFQDGAPGLFLVVASDGDPTLRVEGHGGSVVLRLNGNGMVVARLTLTRALALQRAPGIRMVGGIHMNMERYRALLASLGATGIAFPQPAPGPAPGPTP